MSNVTPPTPTHIVERNRRNAQHSTGPRTSRGRAITRQNSLKHGLTANPAIGVIENAQAYEEFYELLIEQLQPTNLIEQSLINRIAISLWRLQRAVRAESAVSGLAVASVIPEREHVQAWIRDIHEAWQPRMTEVTDPTMKRDAIRQGKIEPGQNLVHMMRSGLSSLQCMFDEEIMSSASGLSAVILMITGYAEQLDTAWPRLTTLEIDMFAWLLGTPAHCFPIVLDENETDTRPFGADPLNLLRQIENANRRDPVDPDDVVLAALHSRIESRLAMFRQQRRVVANPATETHHEQQQTATLLPDATVIDRLLRYETHAERSLHRCLNQLAILRGEAVETITASLTTTQATLWNIQPVTPIHAHHVIPSDHHDSAKRTQIN